MYVGKLMIQKHSIDIKMVINQRRYLSYSLPSPTLPNEG